MEGPGNIPPVTVEQTHPIRSTYLERYLWERRIPLDVARLYLLEAWYRWEKNTYHALAFPDNAGGFELFDRNRKFHVPPFGPTFICHQSKDIAIFRSALDLLTFAALYAGPIQEFPDFLILNAPIPFRAVQQIIAPYIHKHVFLPNDGAGIAFGNQAVHTLQNCYDHRSLYAGYPTINDWICRIGAAASPIIPQSPVESCNLPNAPVNASIALKCPYPRPTASRTNVARSNVARSYPFGRYNKNFQ